MAQLAIEPGEEVIDVHIVSIDLDQGIGKAIYEGDSGSWVVEEETKRLLGHVVASDILGDVYVVPINNTLDDIRRRLSDVEITLGGEMLEQSPATSLQTLVNRLHTRLMAESNATRFVDIGLGEARRLRKVLMHLLAEVEDPESHLNNPWGSHQRQLDTVLDRAHPAVEELTTQSSARLIPKSITVLLNTRMQIDVLLDKAQLHNPRRPIANPSTTNDGLDELIKDSIDMITAKMFTHQSSSAEIITSGGLWRRFYDELLNEGFSEAVLDQHKDVLRAYARELDSCGSDIQDPSLVRSRAAGVEVQSTASSSYLISTGDLMKLDIAEMPYPSASGRGLRDRAAGYWPQYRMPLSPSTEYATSGLHELSFSFPSPGVKRRIHQDNEGREIPLNAKWTKVKRSLVSPEALDRAGVRYEARPDFVAILGILSREQIMEYARNSAQVRRARWIPNNQQSPLSEAAAGDVTPRAGSPIWQDVEEWDLDLQAWDSDLDSWDPKPKEQEDSDSSDVSGDSDPEDSVTRARSLRSVASSTPPTSVDSLPLKTATERPRPRFENRGANLFPGMAKIESGPREFEAEKSFPRSRRMARESREQQMGTTDQDDRLARKKVALKDTLEAVGIGRATATLLSVLEVAAVDL